MKKDAVAEVELVSRLPNVALRAALVSGRSAVNGRAKLLVLVLVDGTWMGRGWAWTGVDGRGLQASGKW